MKTKVERPNIKIVLGDFETEAAYRQFASGKEGYGSYGVIKINGNAYRLSLNIIEMV